MIHSQENWSDFKKDEVSIRCFVLPVEPIDNNPHYRSSRKSSRTVISISRSRLAVSAVPMSTPSLVRPFSVGSTNTKATIGGWGEASLPLCVGHEIIGKAVKVGDKVTTVKVGDRVGVGAQIWACLECKNCKSDNENYCPHQVGVSLYPF